MSEPRFIACDEAGEHLWLTDGQCQACPAVRGVDEHFESEVQQTARWIEQGLEVQLTDWQRDVLRRWLNAWAEEGTDGR